MHIAVPFQVLNSLNPYDQLMILIAPFIVSGEYGLSRGPVAFLPSRRMQSYFWRVTTTQKSYALIRSRSFQLMDICIRCEPGEDKQ